MGRQEGAHDDARRAGLRRLARGEEALPEGARAEGRRGPGPEEPRRAVQGLHGRARAGPGADAAGLPGPRPGPRPQGRRHGVRRVQPRGRPLAGRAEGARRRGAERPEPAGHGLPVPPGHEDRPRELALPEGPRRRGRLRQAAVVGRRAAADLGRGAAQVRRHEGHVRLPLLPPARRPLAVRGRAAGGAAAPVRRRRRVHREGPVPRRGGRRRPRRARRRARLRRRAR